jgi:hypothetical protein
MVTNISAESTQEDRLKIVANILEQWDYPNPRYLELQGNDFLDAQIAGRSRMLHKEENFLGTFIHYETTFTDLATTSGESVTVTFHREGDLEYPTHLSMPEVFTILTPDLGEEFDISDNDPVTFSWDPTSDDRIKIEFEIACDFGEEASLTYSDFPQSGTLPDTGSITIKTQDILDYLINNEEYDLDQLVYCSCDASVKRYRYSTPNQFFAGGSIKGIQSRSRTIRFYP